MPSEPQALPGARPATEATGGAGAAPAAFPPAGSPLTDVAQHLATLHKQQTRRQTGRPRAHVLERIPRLATDLQSRYQAVQRRATANMALSYAAEWLLDNFYVVEQALRLILDNLPETFYRQLPVLADAASGHEPPRVYVLAQTLVAHAQCEVESSQLQAFVQAYQQTQPLTMGELWALPLMLRLSLLEQLAQGARDLLQRESAEALEQPAQPGQEEIVSTAIASLRRLDSSDWQTCFETLSLVEQTLRQDPAQAYARMDFASRDTYRKRIEELAAGSRASEIAIAQQAIALAQHHTPPGASEAAEPFFGSRRYHVGYYLLGRGRHQLEQEIAYRPSGLARCRREVLAQPTLIYLGGIALGTIFLLAMVGVYVTQTLSAGHSLLLWLLATVLLSLVPALTVATSVLNWLLTHLLPPQVLPKLAFATGVPPDCQTMVVIPCLISQTSDLDSLFRQLELHFLRNPEPEFGFALLSDFTDAPTPTRPEDASLLAYAQTRWAVLNEKYPQQPFYFLHRHRLWNAREQVWMGWERKRGKLHEFHQLLRGAQHTSYSTVLGHQERLSAIRYVLTLDADTLLPRDAVRRLLGTLAHPLQQAEFTAATETGQRADTAILSDGYTILQPRTAVQPLAADHSLFTRVFAGDSGFDLYTLAVSDIYQDVFGAGIYVGKGLYDVDAFERSLQDCIPENTLLSHDLFEGIYGRVGLVSDVLLYEDYPPHYLLNVRRSHRWVRGDWQLLPWLLSQWFPLLARLFPLSRRWQRQNPGHRRLALIDQWKMLDNLRRSLLPPALLGLLGAGWTVFPGSSLFWTALGLLAPAQPLLTDTLSSLWRVGLQVWRQRPKQALSASTGGAEHRPWRSFFLPLRNRTIRTVLFLAFLPYEALLMLDAIATSLWRLCLTRRHLLQWTTAAHTVRLFGDDLSAATTWREMYPSFFLVALLAVGVGALRPAALVVAAPLLLTWLLASQIAHAISRPSTQPVYILRDEERQRLRTLARRTWLFYEQFVGPEDNWLPPDHFQETPRGVVAQRTSPTNTGLYMLSVLAAHDLGYIIVSDYVIRLRFSFASLARLERYRGHFLNWIDTQTLAPLAPRYVSTVDSGNLAACLISLRHGCLGLPEQAVWRWEMWEGLVDTLELLAETVSPHHEAGAALCKTLEMMQQQIHTVRDAPARWFPLLLRLINEHHPRLHSHLLQFVDTAELDTETLRTCRLFAERIDVHLHSVQRQVTEVLPWLGATLRGSGVEQTGLPAPDTIPTWAELPALYERLLVELASQTQQTALTAQIRRAQQTVTALLADLADLAEQAAQSVVAMDFGFLFDPQRHTFHIGYNLDSGRLDPNYYDLLASEARLASLVSIAKQDVPQRHWLHLGRPLTRASNGELALLSWGATMFEYLMPCLLVRHYANTLLATSCRAAVAQQIAYGRQQQVPWGISESGFYAFDPALNYQYRAFGVPGLGFKRGLSDDLVVTPYASLLALAFAPQAVLQNLAHLIELGGRGRYGLYEALDFTPARLQLGQRYALVASYMAHHQGMILLALANYLQGDRMIERLHMAPAMQSIELLLQEQIPLQAPLQFPHEAERSLPEHLLGSPRRLPGMHAWTVPLHTPLPLVHVLANGRFATLVSNSGGGYSQYKDLALTRWRSDTTLDDWGLWLYLQERERGLTWAATAQPLAGTTGHTEVRFHPHMVEWQRQAHEISLHTEITVAVDEDVEIRRLTLSNDSDTPRVLQLTTYGEVVLAPLAADQRHQAFTKLFVESAPLPTGAGLLFRRRPRSAHEQPSCLVHMLVAPSPDTCATITWESDRARFLGRQRTPHNPLALETPLSNTTGATLDPVMALRTVIRLAPGARVSLAVITLAAEHRQAALHLAQRYQTWTAVERAFLRARSSAEQELHQLGLESEDVELMQRLLSGLLYPYHALRTEAAVLAANSKGQDGLWAYGISGDYPILLVCVADESAEELLQRVLQAHTYWRRRGVQVDLVLFNQRESSYNQEIQGFLLRLLRRLDSEEWLNQRGGIFIVRSDQLPEADRLLLHSAARVVLYGDRGTLAEQLGTLLVSSMPLPAFVPTQETHPEVPVAVPQTPPSALLFDNGYGGFSADGREYVIYRTPPSPWCNVIANRHAGFLISDSGGGYTWVGNSGENRLTTWRNDPVSDQPSEVLYLRDEETAALWSATPQPVGAAPGTLTRHGAGYTIFQQQQHHLSHELRLFMAPEAPVKLMVLRLVNLLSRPRRLTVTLYVEWVLGVERSTSQQYIVSTYDEGSHALLARNAYHTDCGAAVAFVSASKTPHGLTSDRSEFLGRLGTLQRPAALERIGLSGRIEAGNDPCAAFQVHLDLPAQGTDEVTFVLGQAPDRATAVTLAQRFQDVGQVQQAWEETGQMWDHILGAVQVQTPDLALNVLLNRWLLYQTLSCRFWGRAALYQSSGAFGFRDQLQDVMALLHSRPDLARAHILEAARHQFEAGDVLHWWHPPADRGVRTHISDDFLWLPYVTAHYVAVTGDLAIMHEAVPFLHATPLGAGEEDRYAQYAPTAGALPLYEHCRRALVKARTRGPHGLPLIGAGDWNDGMNRVGIGGRGESVWLGWFLLATLRAFAVLGERLEQHEDVSLYRQQASELLQALSTQAWDGAWYLRAWYDDGTPLGSQHNQECQIDALAQSWAVLAGADEPQRARQAMRSVLERLVKRDARLILLFTPPFDQTCHDPGYIKGYVPGIRENGGQYTHAALWTIWAFALLREGDLAGELLRLINPVWRSATPDRAARYQVEPYVIAADVYGVEPHTGRGGWTWYTGSAGWLYRLGLEAIVGLQRQGNSLTFTPCLPSDWPHVSVTYRYGATTYTIQIIQNQEAPGREVTVTVDGIAVADGRVLLQEDGQVHQVVVAVG
ncbi:MAG: glucoamylase family protein [Candidatus Tectimicrobiota bacterium]